MCRFPVTFRCTRASENECYASIHSCYIRTPFPKFALACAYYPGFCNRLNHSHRANIIASLLRVLVVVRLRIVVFLVGTTFRVLNVVAHFLVVDGTIADRAPQSLHLQLFRAIAATYGVLAGHKRCVVYVLASGRAAQPNHTSGIACSRFIDCFTEVGTA